MSLKGTIKAGHIPVNKFRLLVVGLPPLTPTSVSGIEEEIDSVELPDRTRASGGTTKPVTFTAKFPEHHKSEVDALEKWLLDGQDPVDPNYKKAATLSQESIDGKQTRSWTLYGTWITKHKLPDLDMKNAGDMAEVEYSFSADDMVPQ